MGKSSYSVSRREYLKIYAEKEQLPIGGSFQGKECYPHILKFKERECK